MTNHEFGVLGIALSMCFASSIVSTASAADPDILQAQNQIITPITPTNVEMFGTAVSLDGNQMIVGSPFWWVDPLTETGMARIYNYDSVHWIEHQMLPPNETTFEDSEYGSAVSILGDVAVVGAPRKNSAAGAVVVHELSGTTWTEIIELAGSGTERFGTSLSQSTNRIAVGAPYSSTGAVYLYNNFSGTWTLEQTIPGPAGGALFGTSVELFTDSDLNDWLVVGAPKLNTIGAAHVYKYISNNWVLNDSLVPSDSQTDAPMGGAVAITQTTLNNKLWIFAGRPLHDSNQGCIGGGPPFGVLDNGIVEVYRKDGPLSEWILEAIPLRPPDCFNLGYFGFSIDTDYNQIAVSSPGAYSCNLAATGTGAAYAGFYDETLSQWYIDTKLIPSTQGNAGDSLGTDKRVSIDAGMVVVGGATE